MQKVNSSALTKTEKTAILKGFFCNRTFLQSFYERKVIMKELKNQKFSDFLSLSNIVCNVEETNTEKVLELLLETVKRSYPELDIDRTGAEVKAREAVFPSVVASGLAVPHARLNGLKKPLVSMVCTPNGAVAKEQEKVYVTILLLTPQDDPNLHLQVMSALAAVFATPSLIADVANAATPQDVFNLLQRAGGGDEGQIPAYLKAADIMSYPPALLQETDTVAHAIRTFATTNCVELPVLDSAGDLRGLMSLSDLLRHSLPEHLLWMEDLTPIYQFQPFKELLRVAEETKVGDFMREEFLVVDVNVPAVQLAKLFLVNGVQQLLISRDGKFAGIVEQKSFCARLFWE